jgi:hypothetical protein
MAEKPSSFFPVINKTPKKRHPFPFFAPFGKNP